jgi:ceramide glucosyltransferase
MLIKVSDDREYSILRIQPGGPIVYQEWMDSLACILIIPVITSVIFWSATICSMATFRRMAKQEPLDPVNEPPPSVSILKPVCGLEKNLYGNLISACRQVYSGPYEIIFAIHEDQDPAIQVIEQVKAACPQANIRVVIDESRIGANGKISNLQNAIAKAMGEVIVISDSDMHLRPDYLNRVVTPLYEPGVGIVCTLYRARRPDNFQENLELLTFNVDFVPSMIFAYSTGVSVVCPGASMAVRREVLDSIGGFMPLRNYLVEDYELARRAAAKGYRTKLIPYVAGMDIHTRSWSDWWRHQVGWDLKTRSANKWGYFFTLLVRGIPFAFLYLAAGGPHAWGVLLATVMIRVGTGVLNSAMLGDQDGMRRIWILPVRDMLGLMVWMVVMFKKKTIWRGKTFLIKKGKLVPVR